MGIYIPNMEMPKSCGDCRLRMAVGCCGNLPHNTRMPNCHLVEVHTPHGQLIDADELDTSILQAGFSYAITRRNLRYTPGEVRQKIANAPTIIPAEEGE